MKDIKVIHANKSHKEFLIYANKAIDNINNTNEKVNLS